MPDIFDFGAGRHMMIRHELAIGGHKVVTAWHYLTGTLIMECNNRHCVHCMLVQCDQLMRQRESSYHVIFIIIIIILKSPTSQDGSSSSSR